MKTLGTLLMNSTSSLSVRTYNCTVEGNDNLHCGPDNRQICASAMDLTIECQSHQAFLEEIKSSIWDQCTTLPLATHTASPSATHSVSPPASHTTSLPATNTEQETTQCNCEAYTLNGNRTNNCDNVMITVPSTMSVEVVKGNLTEIHTSNNHCPVASLGGVVGVLVTVLVVLVIGWSLSCAALVKRNSHKQKQVQ